MVTFTAPLQTERLTLRLLTEGDLDSIHRYQSDPDVVQHMYWHVFTRDETLAHLNRRLGKTRLDADGDVLVVAVDLPASPDDAASPGAPASPVPPATMIGEITVFLHSVEHAQFEIGWAFDPAHQRRGYATEAARRMLDYCFETAGAHRVTAHLDPRNTASAAVATRLGMNLEAHFREDQYLKGEWTDSAIYAIRRPEWEASHGSVPDAAAAVTPTREEPLASATTPIRVAALALIRGRRLLMVTARARDVLYLPGGKIDPGESAAEALVREVREEISLELDRPSIRHLFTLSVQAHGEPEGRMVEMFVFASGLADAAAEPRASNEIDALHWVTAADADRCPPAGVETLRRLADLGWID